MDRIDALLAFVTIADLSGFSAAASPRRLERSPSSLSLSSLSLSSSSSSSSSPSPRSPPQQKLIVALTPPPNPWCILVFETLDGTPHAPRTFMSWSDSPWVRGGLRISRAAIEVVERDAIVGYEAEQEACGYLAGPISDPLLCDRAEPIENLAKILHQRDPQTFFHPARKFFAFHERTLEAAIRQGVERGSPVKILYHSHLDVGAYMSGTDEAVLSRGSPPSFIGGTATLGPGPAWAIAFLVTSVRRTDGAPFVDDHRLFIWEDTRFVASTFTLV